MMPRYLSIWLMVKAMTMCGIKVWIVIFLLAEDSLKSTFEASVGQSDHDSYEVSYAIGRIDVFTEICRHLLYVRDPLLLVPIFHCHFQFQLFDYVVYECIVQLAFFFFSYVLS